MSRVVLEMAYASTSMSADVTQDGLEKRVMNRLVNLEGIVQVSVKNRLG